MKHVLLLAIVMAVVYTVWAILGPDQRDVVKKFVRRHGPWIATMIVVLLACLFWARYTMSPTII